MQARTVRGWVVVNRGGHPFVETVCALRRQSIATYNLNAPGSDTYREDRRRYGVRVVRCTITTESPDGT